MKEAFRATEGLDAANQKIINVAKGDHTVLTDGVNVELMIQENTIQQYDPNRGYRQHFAVLYNNRVYTAKADMTAPVGLFVLNDWESMRVDPEWEYINSVPVSGYNLTSGQYIQSDSRYNELSFNMPVDVTDGTTIVVKDVGGVPGTMETVFKSSTSPRFEVYGSIRDDFTITIPYSVVMLIYKAATNNWVVNVDALKNQTRMVGKGSDVNPYFQLQSGDDAYRLSSQGLLKMQLPLYANDGDVILTYDLDGLNPINHTRLQVHPDSNHSIMEDGTTSIIGNTSGWGAFVFSAGTNLWRVFDADLRTRAQVLQTDTDVKPFDHIIVTGDPNQATQSTVFTLPEDSAIGDSVEFTLDYMRKGQTVTIQVPAGSNDVILGNKGQTQFERRSEYPATGNWPFVESLTYDAIADYVPYLKLVYTDLNQNIAGIDQAWVLAEAEPRVERVDATRRDRLGVAALAEQAEVNKNHEANPNDETIVTPKTLANKVSTESRRGIARIATTAEVNKNTGDTYLDDVIVTPKKLNDKRATETAVGLAEIATQAEVNAGTDNTRFVTPLKLAARKASETLAGIIALVKYGATAGTARNTAGTGVYDRNNHVDAVTPKVLDEFRATETAKGVGYLATEAETIGGSDNNAEGALLVTAVNLHKKTATESRIGFTETATQTEVNAGTDDFRYVTPKKLDARRSSETLAGIAEIATQAEFDAGTDNTRITTPLRVKTFFTRAARFAVNLVSGLKFTGDAWNGINLDIEPAAEAQRGTARVATQVETVAGTDDTTIVTPKKLHNKRSSKSEYGIARVATQAETVAGSSQTEIVCPAELKYVMQSEATWSSTESRRGPSRLGSMAAVFVGNNTEGSTQAYTVYTHDGVSVSPRGLNYALQNFLPKMATTQNSLKLGGVLAADWVRRTVAQTITGAMTFTAPAVMDDISAKTVNLSGNLNIATQSGDGFRSIIIGSGGSNSAGFLLSANTNTNNWALYAGGNGSSIVDPTEIGICATQSNGVIIGSSVLWNRSGDQILNRHLHTTNGSLYIRNAGQGLYIGGTGSAERVVRLTGTTNVLGNTSRALNIETNGIDALKLVTTSGTYTLTHSGNQQSQLNPVYVRRDGANTMDATLRFVAPDNTKMATFNTANRYVINRGTDLAIGNVDTNGRVVLDSNMNPAVKIGNFVYEIYHKGNKPTAEDVGAVDVTGSSADNLTIKDWIKVGNVKIVANNLTKTVEFIWEE